MDLPYDVYLGLLIPESSQKRAQLHQAIRPNRFAPKQIWDTHHLHYLIGYWRELNEYTEQNFAPGTPIKAFVAIIDFSILHYGSYGPGTFRNDIERVFEFRKLYPFVPIVLCVDKETYEDFKSDLPPEWRHRLEHYYTVQYDRQDFDECCARIVANAVSWSQRSVHRKLDEKRRQCMVFVSYARKDVRRARQIVACLKRAGYSVWFDQQTIVGGDQWLLAIQQGIEQCFMVVLLVTPDSLASVYVQQEYNGFIEREKPILPAIVRAVPEIPPVLKQFQYLLLVDANMKTVCESICLAVEKQARKLPHI